MAKRKKQKTSPIYILLVLFLILVIGWIVLETPRGEEPAVKLLFPNFETEEVVKIQIKEPEEEYVIVKGEKEWLLANLDNFPAEKESVENVLNKIKDLKEGEVVSTNSEKQDVYEVNEKGIQVLAYNGSEEELANFFVGKRGLIWPSQYLRINDSSKVMMIPENLGEIFDRSKKDWKDKTILALEMGKIVELKIQWEEETVTFKRVEDKWIIGDKEANTDKLNPLLSAISDFRASGFGAAEDYDFESGSGLTQIHVVLNTGEGFYVKAVKKDETANEYGVKTSLKETVYKLGKAGINKFQVKGEELFKVEEVEEENAEEIVDDLEIDS